MLPSSGVTTSMVANEIGLNSHDVGQLVSWEKGKTYSAFDSDGRLLPSKEPYWNIYSVGIPAYWLPGPNTVGGYPIMHLTLGDPLGRAKYSYRLGGFRSYNHSAVPPVIDSVKVTSYNPTWDINDTVHCDLGSFNWIWSANSTVKKACILLQNYESTLTYTKMPTQTLNPLGQRDLNLVVKKDDVPANYSYDMRVALCAEDDSVIGVLPQVGKYWVDQVKESKWTVKTNISNTYVDTITVSESGGKKYVSAKVHFTALQSSSLTFSTVRATMTNNGTVDFDDRIFYFSGDESVTPTTISRDYTSPGSFVTVKINVTPIASYIKQYDGVYELNVNYN